MKLLLHVCCAPCTAGAMMRLEQDDIHPVLYWNNPNIHPLLEYKARFDAMQAFAERESLPLFVDGEYGLRSFMGAVGSRPDDRCRYCYAVRLDQAARHAAAEGFDAFSTTLLISPYQNADMICEIGEAAGKSYGVAFQRYDFQPFFRAGQEKIRDMSLYMQKYCGCVFSEEDRYARKKKQMQGGFRPNFAHGRGSDPVRAADERSC